MKKILLGAACLVAVAAAGFGGYTYYENQRTMDPWLKANLAALASIEDIGQGEGTTAPKGANQCFRIDQCHYEKGKKTLICNMDMQSCPSAKTNDFDDDWYSSASTCFVW